MDEKKDLIMPMPTEPQKRGAHRSIRILDRAEHAEQRRVAREAKHAHIERTREERRKGGKRER